MQSIYLRIDEKFSKTSTHVNFRSKWTSWSTQGRNEVRWCPGQEASLAPMFEPEIFRKQMYCIDESTCDIVGTFRRPHSHSAPR